MTKAGGAKVINAKRSKLMSDRWNDPTKGADGLTYRERRRKAARDQRERELKTKGGDAPTKKKTEGDPTPPPSSTPAPGDPPTPPANSERRGYTPGRAWR